MDKHTLEVYERYVLAQFKYSDAKKIEQERKEAIESLIPGTQHFYHLYFLDLVKRKKKLESFSKEETDLYAKFNKNFGQTEEFYEVEMYIILLNRMESMKPMNEDTDDKAVTDSIDLMTYLQDNFLQNRGSGQYYERPDWMNDHNNDSSASEGENEDSLARTSVHNIS
jgi:hypothetical protein